MGDIAKKTVSIYIDQASAELALDKLQQKADAFSKKAEEARQRQQQLNAELTKAKAAAAGLDGLKAQYTELEKGISKTARALDVTTAAQKKLASENKSLSATLEAATTKAAELQAQIDKAKASGEATKRLENNYEALSKSIEETTAKLRTNEAATAAAATRQQALATQLQNEKAAAAALNKEVKEAAGAASSVGRLTAEYGKLDKQLTTSKEALDKNLAAQKLIQEQVDAGLRPSFNQLTAQVRQLEKELKNLSEDAPGYAQKLAAFQEASDQLKTMQDNISGVKEETTSLLDEFKGVAFAVAAGGAIESALEYVPSLISDTIKAGAQLSDELADVQKSTGLTAAEVQNLNSQLGKIDTRTATSELRQIAVGLGQIGEAATKANVAAIDKIVVALGDEFGGGANEITNVLSVLRNNLQDLKTADYAKDVEHIGNALNVLGADGLATAPVVTDIANRIAGISEVFKVTSGEILGFAATFQETGIEVERGSTALVKLFQAMAAEPEKFAKVAGLSVKDFTNLVNTDMSAAFIKVAKGVQQAGSQNVTFSKTLKQLDADGSGAGEVLSKLAANSDLLEKKQKLAGQALKENSSITQEFTLKNSTLGAEVEKLGKLFNSAFSNSAFNNFLKGAVVILTELFQKTKDVNTVLDEQRDSFQKLQTDVVPVITRYDELQKKAAELGGVSKLSKSEQEELKQAILAVGQAIPSAITQFDAYGNAISISSDRAREYIELKKLMLKDANRDAITAQQSRIRQLQQEKEGFDLQFDVAKRNLTRQQDLAVQARKGGYYNSDVTNLLSIAEQGFNVLKVKINEYDAAIKGAQLNLKSLQGEDLLDAKPKDPHTHEDTGTNITDLEKQRRAAAGTFQTDADAKAAAAARKKELAAQKAANKELNEEERQREKEWEEHLAAMNALSAKWRKQQEEQLKEYPEIQAKLDQFFDTEYNVQLRKIKEFYDKKAELFGNDAQALKQIYAAEDAELQAFFNNQVAKAAEASSRQQIERINAAYEHQQQDRLKQDELDALNSHGRAKRDAQIKQLEDERTLDLQNTQLTETQRELLIREYELRISEVSKAFALQRLEQITSYAQQVAGVLANVDAISTNRENAELSRDKRLNDAKRKNLEQQLKSKAISQAEYNRKLATLDAEDDARQETYRKKQFDRQKRLELLQAGINGAQAILKAAASAPFPANLIPIGFATLTTATQIAAIASKKYARGGYLQGGSHANGGIAMIDRHSGREVGEAEGNEVILSKKTVRNNWDIVSPLLSASMYAGGAKVQFPWQSRSYQGINYSSVGTALRVVKKFENGGILDPNVSTVAPTAAQQQSNAISEAMLQMMDKLSRRLDEPLKAYTSLYDQINTRAQYDRIVKTATGTRS